MKSIPISNYGHLNEPQISQSDYLKFTDFSTLNEAIINAINMPSEQVLNIQKNLESFYNDKLSPVSFLRKFENRNSNELSLIHI